MRFVVVAFSVFSLFFSSTPSFAKSKNDARAELKAKYFIAYDSAEQFNKAFSDNNVDVVRLFFESNGGFPDLDPPISAFNDKFAPPSDDGALRRYLNHAIEMGSLEIVRLFIEIENIGSGEKSMAIRSAVQAAIFENDCKPDIVKYLYARDIKLEDGHTDDNTGSEDLIKQAAGHNCDAIVALLLRAHPTTAAKAMTAFTEQNKSVYDKDHSAKAVFWTSDFQKRYEATLKSLKDANSFLCKPDDGLDSCRVLKEYEEFEKVVEQGRLDQKSNADKAQMEAEYRKTPEYHFLTACTVATQKKAAQDEIAKQKKIASVSGVKDEKALYDAGVAITNADAAIKEHSAEYKKLTGKALNLKKCKAQAQ